MMMDMLNAELYMNECCFASAIYMNNYASYYVVRFMFLSILLQHHRYVKLHGARCPDIGCIVVSSSSVGGSGTLQIIVGFICN